MGRKVRLHHRDLHRRGNERAWWQQYGIDPLSVASSLWITTHSVEPTLTDATESDSAGTVDGRDLAGIDPASPGNDETRRRAYQARQTIIEPICPAKADGPEPGRDQHTGSPAEPAGEYA